MHKAPKQQKPRDHVTRQASGTARCQMKVLDPFYLQRDQSRGSNSHVDLVRKPGTWPSPAHLQSKPVASLSSTDDRFGGTYKPFPHVTPSFENQSCPSLILLFMLVFSAIDNKWAGIFMLSPSFCSIRKIGAEHQSKIPQVKWYLHTLYGKLELIK